jgi:hypothetical protein
VHTARQLSQEMFAIEVAGRPGTRDDVFPDWHAHDRIGVVMLEPYGALGASHLMQLAITAFYDVRPERRAGRLLPGYQDPRAIYPELYIFHVGGRFGDHSAFDAWPARKEVFVEDDPRAVLDAINDRAITRLAVPDSAERPVQHAWKEAPAARDRIASAFAYDPSGRVTDPDISIAGLTPQTEANVEMVLNPERALARVAALAPADDLGPDLRARSWEESVLRRAGEAAADRAHGLERRRDLCRDGCATEHYRRIAVDSALALLVNGA